MNYKAFTIFLLIPVLLFGGTYQIPASNSSYQAKVILVPDGGTLEVEAGGVRRTLKLIGIDVPVRATREEHGQEPWGTYAQQHLALLVMGKEIQVEHDVVVPAEDGALWCYARLGGLMLNEEMVSKGLAMLATAPPNVKYVEKLQAAQVAARESSAGIWAPDNLLPEPPAQFVARQKEIAEKKAAKIKELSIPEWKDGCIVANGKTEVYHKPGGRYYECCRISKHVVYFESADKAEACGFRASKR